MIRHQKITKQVSYKFVNPKLPAFDHEKMAISQDIKPWQADFHFAFVDSYGAAGSNSALILRQKPSHNIPPAPVQLSKYPLFLSAGLSNILSQYSKKLLSWLKDTKAGAHSVILASLHFNLADRANHALSLVLATTVSSAGDLKGESEAAAAAGSGRISLPQEREPVVLVSGG